MSLSDGIAGQMAAPGLAVLYVGAALVLVWVPAGLVGELDPAAAEALIAEGGPVEAASAALLAILAGGLAILAWRYRMPDLVLLATIAALLAARELDLDKAGFTEGLLKSAQYVGPDVPAAERLASAMLLLAILATVALAARRFGPLLLRGLGEGAPSALLVLTGGALMVASKTVDGAARKLAPFGIDLSQGSVDRLRAFEEIAELAIAIAFLAALAAWRQGPPSTESN